MDACNELIRWVGVTDLDNLDHALGMAMVKAAIEAMEAVDEDPSEDLEGAFESLLEIQDDFLQGGLPANSLRGFADSYKELFTRKTPVGPSLEDQLRAIADELSEEEWCTGSYLKLEAGADAFERGDEKSLVAALDDLELVIQQAWENYAGLSIAQSEITAESVAGHGLLQEGVQEWFAALDCARAATRGEAEWDDALEIAENANRLLVAVCKFSTRHQTQTPLAG
jgi:hypothetical protein